MVLSNIKAIFLIIMSLLSCANAMEETRNAYTNQEESEIEILSDLELTVDPSAKFFTDEEGISGYTSNGENEEFESFVCNSDDDILCTSDGEFDKSASNHAAIDRLSDVDLLMHVSKYKNLSILALLASKSLLRTDQVNHASTHKEKKRIKRSRSAKRRVRLPVKLNDYELKKSQGDLFACDAQGCDKAYHWKTSLQRHQRIVHGKKIKAQ